MRPEPSLRLPQSRRDLCRQLLFASTLPILGGTLEGCTSFRGAAAGGRDAALLLPLTGDSAALGQAMARAASLVLVADPAPAARPSTTPKDPPRARSAARKALDAGAQVLFGPLRADQTPAVLAEAGKAPVVTFSNDDRLAAQAPS